MGITRTFGAIPPSHRTPQAYTIIPPAIPSWNCRLTTAMCYGTPKRASTHKEGRCRRSPKPSFVRSIEHKISGSCVFRTPLVMRFHGDDLEDHLPHVHRERNTTAISAVHLAVFLRQNLDPRCRDNLLELPNSFTRNSSTPTVWVHYGSWFGPGSSAVDCSETPDSAIMGYSMAFPLRASE